MVARICPILDEDADEELLALLGRDSDPEDYPERHEYDGRDRDPPLTFAERERNRRLREIELAKYAAQQERWKAERERDGERRGALAKERAAQRRAESNAELRAANAAAREAYRQRCQDERSMWEGMLIGAAERVRGTPHEARMLPDLERDLATIRSFPPGPIPWMLNAERFEAEFQRRLGAT
jgi:hypothetical protein